MSGFLPPDDYVPGGMEKVLVQKNYIKELERKNELLLEQLVKIDSITPRNIVIENTEKWISVDIIVPPEKKNVLVYIPKNKDIRKGFFMGDKCQFMNSWLYKSEISHWMPTPEEP